MSTNALTNPAKIPVDPSVVPTLLTTRVGRERITFDDDWRFALGHATDAIQDFGHGTSYFSYLAKAAYGDGPASEHFDDRGWRRLDLPHDWAVELPFSDKGSASHGYKAIGRAFPGNSVGWYRRSFFIPESDLGRRIAVEFDGIYRNSRVFVNGCLLGEHPSGYLGTSYDLSAYLNYGGTNVIAVRADASQEEGWYYEGAGIYRHVWLLKTDPLHVARHGTWVRTELQNGEVHVLLDTDVENSSRTDEGYVLAHTITDDTGAVVLTSAPLEATCAAGARASHHQSLKFPKPRLWTLDDPFLYKLVTVIQKNGDVIDRYETPFGVRTVRFDPAHGFFLNGERVVLKGTNNHQDHAGVGVAIPDGLQTYRIIQLKAMGSNAYRSAHNPPTPELLDECDRLGMLVIDENRLMGTGQMHLDQVAEMILRDRNHPSVVLWSIGNEEWGIEGHIRGARITVSMQDFVKRLDPTRTITAAISGGWGGISRTIEAAGVNYIKQGDTDKEHAAKPWQVILGTEETTTQATRGIYVDDRERAHLSPQEDGSSGGNAELGWKHYASRPYAAGIFFWTGFDYRGEPTPFEFPGVSSQFGILDTCGFPKDGFYYLKSWWGNEDVLHIFPHWNWPDREGQTLEVRAHSNCEEVELLLNGASLGRKQMPINGHLAWDVSYAKGTLLARGFKGGREVLSHQVETTGEPSQLKLTVERTQSKGTDTPVSVVNIAALDAQGRVVPTANQKLHFSLSGPGRILGVGNGDPSCLEADVSVPSSLALALGNWTAPDPAVSSGNITFEAKFDKPDENASPSLLLSALGPSQSAYLNGEVLYENQVPEHSRVELSLTETNLRPTGNVIRIEATRYGDYGKRESLREFHPARIRLQTPAAPLSRSAFNGLAQVIVQCTDASAEVILTVESEGLTPARVVLLRHP